MEQFVQIETLIKQAKTAALSAGNCLRQVYSKNKGVLSSCGKDIKTEADKAAELLMLKSLRSNGYAILSEESGLLNTDNDFPTICDSALPIWIIDPLDGTFNFTRGFPCCCVSIALWRGLNPVLGVIYDFVSEKLYSGVAGKGASCNDLEIKVSSVGHHDQAALAMGFPSCRDYSNAALAESISNVQRFKKIRMIGSAALSLAYVATGIFDAYLEEDIWLWDVAAGLAMVKAAGGSYVCSDTKDSFKLNVAASNGLLAI